MSTPTPEPVTVPDSTTVVDDLNLPVAQAWANVMRDVAALGKHEKAQAGATRFNFRGIDAVMNAVGPALRRHGVTVVPQVRRYEREQFESKNGGRMVGTLVEVEYVIIGPLGADDGVIVGSAFGEASDAGDKSMPKAMSVAFRTFLLQALTLPTDEPDPDTHIVERASGRQAAPEATITEAQRDTITALFDTMGLDPEQRLAGIHRYTGRAVPVEELTTEEADRVLVPLQRAVDNQAAAPSQEDAAALVARSLGGTPVES